MLISSGLVQQRDMELRVSREPCLLWACGAPVQSQKPRSLQAVRRQGGKRLLPMLVHGSKAQIQSQTLRPEEYLIVPHSAVAYSFLDGCASGLHGLLTHPVACSVHQRILRKKWAELWC